MRRRRASSAAAVAPVGVEVDDLVLEVLREQMPGVDVDACLAANSAPGGAPRVDLMDAIAEDLGPAGVERCARLAAMSDDEFEGHIDRVTARMRRPEPKLKAGNGRMPVALIRPAPENDTLYRPITTNDPEIVELAKSIGRHGLREPLVVTLDRYILSGHRRHAACRLAGLTEVPVRVEGERRAHPPGELGVVRRNDGRRLVVRRRFAPTGREYLEIAVEGGASATRLTLTAAESVVVGALLISATSGRQPEDFADVRGDSTEEVPSGS